MKSVRVDRATATAKETRVMVATVAVMMENSIKGSARPHNNQLRLFLATSSTIWRRGGYEKGTNTAGKATLSGRGPLDG
jgi:hypothetical protein